jgi:hypothetical protein
VRQTLLDAGQVLVVGVVPAVVVADQDPSKVSRIPNAVIAGLVLDPAALYQIRSRPPPV